MAERKKEGSYAIAVAEVAGLFSGSASLGMALVFRAPSEVEPSTRLT